MSLRWILCAVAAVTVAGPAWAGSDAPTAEVPAAASTSSPGGTNDTSAPSAATQLEAKPASFSFFSAPLAAGAGAAVVSVPASLALATWFGSLSPSLIVAALPAVVAFVAIPPIAVVLTEWAVANALSAGSAKISPAIWASVGAQLVVLLGAIALGIHAGNVVDASVLTLVEAIVLPSTSWFLMRPKSGSAEAAQTAAAAHARESNAALEARFDLPRVARFQVASWTF